VAYAWLNCWLIAKKVKIRHFWNGLLHGCVAVLIGYKTEWHYGLAVVFIARVVFDVSLNLFRGLPVDYISPEVKSYNGLRMAIAKGKVIDYVEYKAFGGNGYIPKIIYIGVIIALMSI